jgi:hypothetical protein
MRRSAGKQQHQRSDAGTVGLAAVVIVAVVAAVVVKSYVVKAL